jgi:hypothetical protein
MIMSEAGHSKPVRKAIEACHALTVRMIEHASAGRWSQVMCLEEERRQCFEHPEPAAPSQDDPVDIQAALEALVALDQRLNELAVAARQSALNDLRNVRGKAAASARYHESSRRG